MAGWGGVKGRGEGGQSCGAYRSAEQSVKSVQDALGAEMRENTTDNGCGQGSKWRAEDTSSRIAPVNPARLEILARLVREH